jgi:hypothetical protein
MRKLILILIFILLPIVAQARPDLTLKYHFDSRGYNTFGIWTSEFDFPYGFGFWGFTDLHGSESDPSNSRFAITRSFSEYRISNSLIGDWVHLKGLYFEAELNALSVSQDLIRFGVGYSYSFSLFGNDPGTIWFRGFPIQTNGHSGELSVEWFIPLHERINFSGFTDFDINANGDNNHLWVIEPALNFHLTNSLFFQFEYRYNDYERVVGLEGQGWALGIGYTF